MKRFDLPGRWSRNSFESIPGALFLEISILEETTKFLNSHFRSSRCCTKFCIDDHHVASRCRIALNYSVSSNFSNFRIVKEISSLVFSWEFFHAKICQIFSFVLAMVIKDFAIVVIVTIPFFKRAGVSIFFHSLLFFEKIHLSMAKTHFRHVASS